MTKKQEAVLFRSFGPVLSEIQHLVPVDGVILRDRDLCRRAGMSTKTYGKLKEARV